MKYKKGSSDLRGFTYTYDASGNITKIVTEGTNVPQAALTKEYTYDALGQLATEVNGSGTTFGYAYELLIESVLYMFVYGMSGMVDLPVDWLSPLVLFMRRTSVGHADLVRPISGTGAEVAIANFSGWIYPLVWAVFALLLLVCAGQLYRRRRMESAGDTVAIPVLKPVLKYIVALFAGLAMPVGVYGMLLNVPAYHGSLQGK